VCEKFFTPQKILTSDPGYGILLSENKRNVLKVKMDKDFLRKKLTLYIDATIPNYVFNNHVPDKQKASKKLFKEAEEGKAIILISPVLLEELDAASEPKRTSMLNLI